jgi:hypothetical protein
MLQDNQNYFGGGYFAYDTLIAVDATQRKPVQDFLVGDAVWVATFGVWEPAPVEFSSGSDGGSKEMIMVRFGDVAAPDTLIVSRDQLFLLPDTRLKEAATLVPGTDSLLRPDGTPAPVLEVEIGEYSRGVHAIATSPEPTTDLPRHLIEANGVVCGDYSLRVARPEID